MSTATEIVFQSKCPNQVLTRRQTRHVDDGFGGKKVLSYEEWVAQEEHLNRLREERGEEPKPVDDTPWKVEFVNSRYSPPADLSEAGRERIIEWLRGHNLFNSPQGFFELGKAPDEPQPTVEHQMTEVAEAAAMGDLERAEAVLEVENETHKRPAILSAAGAAVARLRELDSEIGADGDGSQGAPPSTSGD
jgi:hypothetical protein